MCICYLWHSSIQFDGCLWGGFQKCCLVWRFVFGHCVQKVPLIYYVSTILVFFDPLPPYISRYILCSENKQYDQFFNPPSSPYVIYEWSKSLPAMQVLMMHSEDQSQSTMWEFDWSCFTFSFYICWAVHPIFDFRFLLVLADEVTFLNSLACLALQTETIVKKIMQPKLPKTKNKLTKICNEPGIYFTFVILLRGLKVAILKWPIPWNWPFLSTLKIRGIGESSKRNWQEKSAISKSSLLAV